MSKFDGLLGRSDKPTKASPTGPSTRGKSTPFWLLPNSQTFNHPDC